MTYSKYIINSELRYKPIISNGSYNVPGTYTTGSILTLATGLPTGVDFNVYENYPNTSNTIVKIGNRSWIDKNGNLKCYSLYNTTCTILWRVYGY